MRGGKCGHVRLHGSAGVLVSKSKNDWSTSERGREKKEISISHASSDDEERRGAGAGAGGEDDKKDKEDENDEHHQWNKKEW